MNSLKLGWNHYIATPKRSQTPVKIDKILENRLSRYREAREQRLAALERSGRGSNDSNQ